MLLTILCMYSISLFAQMPCGPGVGTVIFDEDFDTEADAATTGVDANGTAWTATCPGCVAGDFFEVDNNSGNANGCNGTNGLRGNDTNGPGTFAVSGLDLTGCAVVTFSFDYCSTGYAGSGNLECADGVECAGCPGDPAVVVSNGSCNNCWDFLYGELAFPSGAVSQEVLLGLDCSVPDAGATASSICGTMLPDGTPISPADLQSVDINIVMAMWAGTENMVIDNIILICYTADEVAACADPAVTDACPEMCPDFSGITAADLSLSITDNTCDGAAGSIAAPATDPCPAGSTLVYSTDGGTNWSPTLPVYDPAMQQTIMAACQCNLDDTMFSEMSSEMTNPAVCCDPAIAAAAPIVVIDSESTCTVIDGTPSGGALSTPTCPAGSTIEYSIDGGAYAATPVPMYDQINSITVQVRCVCDLDPAIIGEGTAITTTPGVCPMAMCDAAIAAAEPAITIDSESTCTEIDGTPSGGALTLPSCPAGSTIEYSIDGGTYAATPVPAYDQSNNIMVQVRCVCDEDPSIIGEGPIVTTNAGECPGCEPTDVSILRKGNN